MRAYVPGRSAAAMLWVMAALAGCGGGSGTPDPTGTGQGGTRATSGSGGAGAVDGGASGAGGGGGTDGGAPETRPPQQHQAGGETWTVLIYMAADNDLEPYALLDLAEMAKVGSTDKMRIVVQVDRSRGYAAGRVADLPDFSGARRLLVHQDSFEVLQDLGDIDSGSPAALSQFITWGATAYPADRTALILWDHGGGWAGFGLDESTGHLIDAPSLRNGIAKGLADARLPRLAMVAFDACLMATFEIAAMLRPYAEYLLASEETIPGHGFDYGSLAAAGADPTIAPPALAQQIASAYVAQSTSYRDEETITLSLIDLYALDDVDSAVAALAVASGMPVSTEKATTIGRARVAAREYGDQGQVRGVMVDLADLAARLAATDAAFAPASAAVAQAVGRATLMKITGRARQGSNGLSVYFPLQLRDKDTNYERVMEVAAWRRFLDGYLNVANAGAVGAPAFADPSGAAGAQLVNGSLVFSGALAAGASAVINKATLYYGLVDPDTGALYVLGSAPASYTNSAVQGTWDLGILRLDQGTSSAYGYLSAEAAADGSASLTIPFAYNQPGADPDQEAFRLLVYDASSTLSQDTYYLSSGGVFGQLTPTLASTLTSLILVADPNGLTEWTKTLVDFDATRPITPGLEQVPGGSLVFGELVIENIQEESSVVFATVTLP